MLQLSSFKTHTRRQTDTDTDSLTHTHVQAINNAFENGKTMRAENV